MSTSPILRVKRSHRRRMRRCVKESISETSSKCNCPPSGRSPRTCGSESGPCYRRRKNRAHQDVHPYRSARSWTASSSSYAPAANGKPCPDATALVRSTVHRRFQQWVAAGIIDAIVRAMVGWYERSWGIDWEWQAADTKLLAAPLGGEATGPNPTDLGKSGTKRHLMVDGRGVPLAFHLSAANRHDLKGLSRLLDSGGLLALRPEPSDQAPQHLCLGTKPTMPKKRMNFLRLWITWGTSSGAARMMWRVVVSRFTRRVGGGKWNARSRGCTTCARRLRVRWEKKAENYRGLWLLAAALITYRRIILG